MNVKSANLSIGESKQLKAKAVPTKNTSTKIAWSSSNKKVAVVSSKGKVTGKATGTATITAKAADGSVVVTGENLDRDALAQAIEDLGFDVIE